MYSNHKAPRKVSRRAVLGTAGVGAVGAAAVGVGIMAFNREPESNNTGQAVENAGTTAAAPEDMVEGSPVVLYLDGRNGPMRISPAPTSGRSTTANSPTASGGRASRSSAHARHFLFRIHSFAR